MKIEVTFFIYTLTVFIFRGGVSIWVSIFYSYAKADKNYTQKGCCADGEPHERARNGVCAHYDDQG